MSPADYQLILLGTCILAALFVFYRLTNSTVKVEWSAKTTEPEQSVAKLKNERDEARAVATRLRSDLEQRNGGLS